MLANFKELYDEGLITAEEYNQKKQEVLGMVSRASQAQSVSAAAPAGGSTSQYQSAPSAGGHYQTHVTETASAASGGTRPKSLTIDRKKKVV